MKRHPALIPISREHHQLLLLGQVLKKDAPAYKGMPLALEGKVAHAQEIWKELFEPHINLEESLLFPAIARKTSVLAGLLSELSHEHKQIALLIEKLKPDEAKMDTLGNLIELHVRKEERMLFQKVQELFSEQEMDELKTLLSAG